MNPNSTILRVKRKRGTDAADALLLACKRIRPESAAQSAGDSVPEPAEGEIENSVFTLVATVSSEDAPIRTHVQAALSRPRVAHALRPSASSAQRISADLRSAKWSTRREERYRILSSHRAGLSPPEAFPRRENEGQQPEEAAQQGVTEGPGPMDDTTHWVLGEVQVVDIVHEDGGKPRAQAVTSEPDDVLCNSIKMIREKLNVSGDGTGVRHHEKDDEYVYDLYCQETASPGWIQDILSVKPYQECELVPDEDQREEEIYDDEDDENDEGNWRNDYPDEEDSEDDSDLEERYMGYDYDEGCGRRSWQRYLCDVHQEFEDHDEEYLDSD